MMDAGALLAVASQGHDGMSKLDQTKSPSHFGEYERS
jgi:hypothetical protein